MRSRSEAKNCEFATVSCDDDYDMRFTCACASTQVDVGGWGGRIRTHLHGTKIFNQRDAISTTVKFTLPQRIIKSPSVTNEVYSQSHFNRRSPDYTAPWIRRAHRLRPKPAAHQSSKIP